MLDLDPAVDLDEVEVARAVDEELERADVLVAGRDDGPDRPLGERRRGPRRRAPASAPPRGSSGGGAGRSSRARRGGRRGRSGRRRPGPRRGGSPRATSRGTASRRRTPRGLGAADRDRRLQLARRADHAHALAAAARRRLDQHRVADALRLGEGVLVVAEHAVRARDRRQAVAGQQPARASFEANRSSTVGRRPDERQVVGADDLGEALVLGQEAVARVDRVAAGHERGAR